MALKDYCVHANLKFPSVSWSGRDFQVSANNKKEAISRARAGSRGMRVHPTRRPGDLHGRGGLEVSPATRAGRKPIAATGERMRVRAVRMTDAEWEKCRRLGGAA